MEMNQMQPDAQGHMHHIGPPAGDFNGHFVPGCSFILFGCLWLFNTLFRYHVAVRQAVLRGNVDKKLNYRNSLFSKYHSGRARTVPVEAAVTLFIVTTICASEVISYILGYPLTLVVHHSLMFASFGLMGMFEVLQHYKFTVPPSSQYLAFMFANLVTGYLLTNHLSGRAIIDTKMHMMLFYMTSLQIIVTGLEIVYNRSVTAGLIRNIMFIAQGFWLCLMGVIIHPLPIMTTYDLNDHALLGVLSAFPILAIYAPLMIAVLMNVFIARRVRNMDITTVNYIVAVTHSQKTSSGTKGEAESPLISDSDYDV